MQNYCQPLLIFASMSQPLQDIAHGHDLALNDHVQWTVEVDATFDHLKTAIASALCLEPRLS